MATFPTNINLSDTTPPAKPDSLNVEWQGDAPVADPNSPGTYVRNASACYRYPKVGGVQILTDDYLFSEVDSGFTFKVDSASPVTLTLPAAPPIFQSPAEGVWFVTIININTGTVTVDPNGPNFDGSASTFTVAQDTGFEVSTDGTDYYSGLTAGGAPGGTNHEVQINSSGVFGGLATGTSGQYLRSGGASADPAFASIAESEVTNLVSDLALKAPLASPALTGTPTAPTPTTGDDSTKIATTAFVEDTIDNLVAGDIPNIAESQVTSLVSDLAAKVPTSRLINTTAPLTGGGDLSADRTLVISNFTGDSGSGGAKGAVPAPAAGDAAAGKFLKADGTWSSPATGLSAVTGITIDGSGAPPTTGSKGYIQVPFAATIVGWTLLADQSGSAQITVKKCSDAGFPTTSSIVASAPPNISSAQKGESSTLTGWTTSITAGDILEFNLDSVTTCTRLTLELKLTRN